MAVFHLAPILMCARIVASLRNCRLNIGETTLQMKLKTKTKSKKKSKKQKLPNFDGLGPKELKNIQRVVRQAWSWSHAWRLVKARAIGPDGFPRCENKKCPSKGKPVPKVFVDHIKAVGTIGGPNYIRRMFIPSCQLQALCKVCHDIKTKEDSIIKDFY